MFLLMIFEKKIKGTRSKFSQGCLTVLQKMINNQKARVKLTNTQLNKLNLQQKIREEQY